MAPRELRRVPSRLESAVRSPSRPRLEGDVDYSSGHHHGVGIGTSLGLVSAEAARVDKYRRARPAACPGQSTKRLFGAEPAM